MSRAADRIIQFSSPSDEKVITFVRLALEAGVVQSATGITASGINHSIGSESELKTFSEFLEDLSSRRIQTVKLTVGPGTQVQFDRAETVNGTANPSFHLAEIFFNKRNNDFDDSLATIESIAQKLFLSSAAMLSAQDTPISSVLGKHVEDLASTAVRIADSLSKSHVEYEQRLSKHEERLAETARKAEQERQKSHQAQLAEIEKERQELKAKLDELDVRRARDARRKLREIITDNVKERISMPSRSAFSGYSRLWIIGLSTTLTLASALSAIVAAFDIYGISSTVSVGSLAVIYGRFFISTAAVAVFGFYLLGYLRKIEAEDRRYERDLERFSLDVDRASWVIETVVDLREDENGLQVPELWLKGATAGLFQVSEAESDDENALDALGELLSVGANLKIGPSGAELELDKSASKKVARSAK